MLPILSRNQIKFIRSLKQKKYRYKFKKYLVEGDKQIQDILRYRPETIEYLVTTPERTSLSEATSVEIFKTDSDGFGEITSLVHPQGILAVCKIPDLFISGQWDTNGFGLYFDAIQDPGNLGTMLRAAEWYGIQHILIGRGTVDPFSPKVVQASMGSQSFLHMYQCDESQVAKMACPILIADMDGQNAYQFEWPSKGILIMGNEGQGVSDAFREMDSVRITLPSAPDSRTESLNVGMACTALLTLRHLHVHSGYQQE